MQTLVSDSSQMEVCEPRKHGVLVVALLVVLIVGGSLVWRDLVSRPIASVRIAGEFENVSRESMQRVVNQFLPSGFLRLNVEAVRRAAGEMPWVRRVSVRRVWPDSLHVAVVERVAVARWNDDAYLEADGTRFVPDQATLDDTMVHLFGPETTEKKVLTQYEHLARMLARLKTPIQSVSLDRRGTWQVQLASGLVLQLGRADNLEFMAPYIASLPKILGDRYGDASQVDLRYRNGFAVKWSKTEIPEEGQSS